MTKTNQKELLSDLPKICRFCENACKLTGDRTMLCGAKGVVSCDYSCKKFSYDPLKRIPKNPPVLPHLNKDDLVL